MTAAALVAMLGLVAPLVVPPPESAKVAEAPAKPAIPTDAEAITAGIARIVAMQEKGPGADIAAEWPYEGVYRVGGNIPYGYRVGGTLIACVALLAWISKRRAYSEEAEWRVSSAGIVIARGKSATRLDPSTVRAIELVEPSGVPQLVIRITRSSDSHATLVPDNWARLAPETVLERIHFALQPTEI